MARPSFHTYNHYLGECHKCGKLFQERNAMGVAARHFDKCGGYISLDVTMTFVWDPNMPRRG